MEDFFDQFGDELLEYLIADGYFEMVGIDKNAEPIYRMTEKMIEEYPEMFEEHLAETNEIIFSLWQKGLVEVTMDPDSEWLIVPTYSTLHYEELDVDLDDEEIRMLDEIIRVHNEKSGEV